MSSSSAENIWSGLEVSISRVDYLSTAEVLKCSYIPTSNGKDNQVWFRREYPRKKGTGIPVKPSSECTGSDLFDRIRKKLLQFRIYLECPNNDRTIHVRWNQSKEIWSAYQRDWHNEHRLLFIIKEKSLAPLLYSAKPYKIPGPDEPDYFPAYNESLAPDKNGAYEVASILQHEEREGVIWYLVRWEDFDDNDHGEYFYDSGEKVEEGVIANDNLWIPEENFDEDDLVLAKYKEANELE